VTKLKFIAIYGTICLGEWSRLIFTFIVNSGRLNKVTRYQHHTGKISWT